MTSLDELQWTFLTALVNEIKPPQTFLMDTLFGNHEAVSTDAIEIGTLRGDRSMAPFVMKGAEGIMVPGLGSDAILVKAPHMRIKKPFTLSSLLFTRTAGGDPIHLTSGQTQIPAVQAHIARDSQRMVDMVRNSEEYLASMAITGVIAYTMEADGAAFQIAFAKDALNTVVLTGADLWTASTSNPASDVLDAKRRLSDVVGLAPTDAIMGASAADAFLNNERVRQDLLTVNKITTGDMTIVSQFNEQGVIFLGTYAGINWWEYSRSINVPGLGLTPLIRDKFVEFVNRSPASDFVTYYGPIVDMDAFEAGGIVSERFSKSWKENDPSVQVQLIESNPLPCLRRPNAIYSLQVVA